MLKHPRLTEERIARAIELLKDCVYTGHAALRVEICEVPGEPVFPARAPESGYRPIQVGGEWGPAWGTAWFRFTGTVPAEWKGRAVSALVRLGALAGEGFTAEGLVWRDGKPERAINVNRADVPLAAPARGGEPVSILIEAGANVSASCWLPVGDPEPISAEPLFTLERAELACFDSEAYELHADLKLAYEVMMELPEATPRRGQLLRACNDALNVLDPQDRATYAAAREKLRDALASRNGGSAHEVSAIGHAHIDTAWLWPLRETIRKCARTFSTQLAYMEEHPEYVFCCSQAQQYLWMKEYYPHIYEGIREAIKRGQWEPVGSMWIEVDCNIPSGESIVRQILHGKNFFMDEFGYETRDCWLPDVFGYSAAMPQVLLKSGIDSFVTQKISWSQFNKFPHHTFLWEGIDGTRVFSHFPPVDTYNANFSPKELAFNVRNFKEHDRANRSLYIYGYGDGGGGPTPGMLAAAARLKDLEGMPKVELEKVSEFLAKAKADARDLPVWVGELYLEYHRGTYTTQARTKRGNRKSEFLLRDAEFFDVLAGRAGYEVAAGGAEAGRAPYDVVARNSATPAGYLDRAWKLLLLNQFHDIIPGSSIARVYQENAADYATIAELGGAIIEPARQSLTERIDTSGAERPVIVFNTAGFARSEVVSLPDGAPVHLEAPACGYAVADAAAQRPVASFAHPVEIIERRRLLAMDNGMLRILIDRATGNLHGVRDHRHDREVLVVGREGNVFQMHRDYPNHFDAWDIDPFAFETCEEIGGLTSIEIVEKTELRATVRIERKFGASAISQRIVMCAGSPRIDFVTTIDWREDHKLLKVAFPVNVRSPRATYEIQYGHTERPTHYNTSWDMARFEVCAQKWADLSEGDYGVALLNDCKYGYDIHGKVMRLSLLRAPNAPDRTADRGHHEFTYALLPHGGDFRKAGVIEQSYALNMPLHVIPAEPHAGDLPERRSYFEVDRPGVLIEAVKHAEQEESVIVRLYEANGSRGMVTLTTALPVKHAFRADLLERTDAPVACKEGQIQFAVRPFEIVTFKLILG
ncbi:MAG TPA: alpha-mannosidase [Chthoniobacteraceae bacterium]|jgi:alpha-mannosidase|nr:alpha-mannosidase [Chthoniobacteraceae bacterium]